MDGPTGVTAAESASLWGRHRDGVDVPDALAVVADRAVRGEEAAAGSVQDRHLRPPLMIEPDRGGVVLAVEVGPVVGEYQVFVPVQEGVDQLAEDPGVTAGEGP